MNEELPFVRLAIEKAAESVIQGGFPAGALVVKNGHIIGRGMSLGNQLMDPTSHGEIAAIREACKHVRSPDLTGSILYTSLQPCLMCLGASLWGMISKIVFACSKEKVSSEYYGGPYDISDINRNFAHPIDMVHCRELENESLEVVRKWEEAQKFN